MTRCLRAVGCALCLSIVFVATVSADYIVRPWNTNTDWSGESPNRDAPELGQCFGNCGAGCSDTWNPGCGGTQYWELQIANEPQPTGYRKGEFMCYGGYCYYYESMRVQAIGRWTYHGYFAWGCMTHDSTCPEFLWGLGCLWFGGCGSGWNQDWSYDAVVFGWQPVYFWEIGPDS